MPPYDISPPPLPPSDLTSPESPDILPSVAASADTQSAPAAPILNPIPSSPGEGGSPQSEPPSPGVVSVTPNWPHPVPGYIETGEVHVFSGASGVGKSHWLAWFISQLQTKSSVLGHPCNRPPFVAFLAYDRVTHKLASKFIRAGWEDPVIYSFMQDPSSAPDQHLRSLVGRKATFEDKFTFFDATLDKLGKQHFPSSSLPPGSLIIVDGMSLAFGIEPAGAYLKNVVVYLAHLSRRCWARGISLFLVHHTAKEKADPNARYIRPQDRALGSMGIQGYTSTQMILLGPDSTEDPSQGCHEFHWASHDAPAESFRFVRTAPLGLFTCIDSDSPFVAPSKAPEIAATRLDERSHRILAFTSELPTPSEEIRAQLPDIPESTFYRRVKILIDDGFLSKVLHEGIPCLVRSVRRAEEG